MFELEYLPLYDCLFYYQPIQTSENEKKCFKTSDQW